MEENVVKNAFAVGRVNFKGKNGRGQSLPPAIHREQLLRERIEPPVIEGHAAQGSQPGYPHLHSGTVLVCGFAATLWDDLAAVESVKPGLPIIAVNEAAVHLPAFAIYSFHTEAEKLGRWTKEQRENFGDGFTVHGSGSRDFYEHNIRNYPHVQYWWAASASRGSSGWCARILAGMMGFDEVVLCGIPLDHRRYADKKPAWYWQSGRTNAVTVFQKAVKADTVHHEGCYSVSGWTRELLGAPPWL